MPLLNNFLYEYFIMRKKIKKRGVGYKKSYQTLTSSEKKKRTKRKRVNIKYWGKEWGQNDNYPFSLLFFSLYFHSNQSYIPYRDHFSLSFFFPCTMA